MTHQRNTPENNETESKVHYFMSLIDDKIWG